MSGMLLALFINETIKQGGSDMKSDFLQELQQMIEQKHDNVFAGLSVRYKVLDKDDTDNQGLFKEAQTIMIGRKGMTLLVKQRIKPEDAILVEIIMPAGNIIKTCCETLSCRKQEYNRGYEIEAEFIILRDSDRHLIDQIIEKVHI